MRFGIRSTNLVVAGVVTAATCFLLALGQPAAAPAASLRALTEFHAPRVPGPTPGHVHGTTVDRQWTSRNWSGYAITGAKYTSVTGTWTVPTVDPPSHPSSDQYSANWVGIDGFLPGDQHLIQAGTEEDWTQGTPFYQAWWEILPAAETPITSITVSPGDTMFVTITQGTPLWTITVKDETTNQSFTTIQRYRGPMSSAEWIQEAPTVGRRIATLADDSTFAFDLCTVNGANPGLASTDSGVMVNKNGTAISVPSVPDTDANGFAVAHGSVAPPPPSG